MANSNDSILSEIAQNFDEFERLVNFVISETWNAPKVKRNIVQHWNRFAEFALIYSEDASKQFFIEFLLTKLMEDNAKPYFRSVTRFDNLAGKNSNLPRTVIQRLLSLPHLSRPAIEFVIDNTKTEVFISLLLGNKHMTIEDKRFIMDKIISDKKMELINFRGKEILMKCGVYSKEYAVAFYELVQDSSLLPDDLQDAFLF